MKFAALVAFVTLLPTALAVTRDPTVFAREAGTRVTGRDALEKKACVPTSCSCQGVPNGLFCGDGVFNCIKGHVYQCGEDGKKSCDFGVRNSCVQCNQLTC